METLEEHGDNLGTARPVVHWAYFPTSDACDGFIGDARGEGFELDSVSDDGDGERSFRASITRHDSVELDDIHEVVMTLVQLAERHSGFYDGWETPVVPRPEPRGWFKRKR